MGFFHKQKAEPTYPYNAENETPLIRCSICTGEQVAGFKDLHTGAFHEVMLIRNAQDLETFKHLYGLTHVDKSY